MIRWVAVAVVFLCIMQGRAEDQILVKVRMLEVPIDVVVTKDALDSGELLWNPAIKRAGSTCT